MLCIVAAYSWTATGRRIQPHSCSGCEEHQRTNTVTSGSLSSLKRSASLTKEKGNIYMYCLL